MAELTYDPTPADQPEFNEAEQEALAIGEAAAREEQAHYAGKFKSAEDLEQAYIELQKKLGSNENETNTDAEEAGSEEEQLQEEEVSPAAELITNASQMYAETGELTPEVMEQFNSMSSSDLVSAYMEMQGELPSQSSPDLTESEVNVIKNFAGGEEGYTNLMQWAAGNLEQADVDAFDSIVDKGDARAIRLAVAGLKAQYEAMNGFEGEMVSGKAPRQVNDVFRSQAEVVAAMQDPRYDNDPAYRNDVFNKLQRSDIQY